MVKQELKRWLTNQIVYFSTGQSFRWQGYLSQNNTGTVELWFLKDLKYNKLAQVCVMKIQGLRVFQTREAPPSLTFLASPTLSSTSTFLLTAMLATGFELPLELEAPSEEPPAKEQANVRGNSYEKRQML